MHIAIRARTVHARHRWISWAVIAALAGVLAVTVYHRIASLERARAEWGATRAVLVADAPMEPDGAISVRTVHIPIRLTPDTALEELPAGARVHQHIGVGEVLVETDFAGAAGPASHAAVGQVVVGTVDPLAGTPTVGTRVRVASEGIVLAENAVVTQVSNGVVFIAVDEIDGPIVAAAAHGGTASLMYVP